MPEISNNKKQELSISYEVFESTEALSRDEQDLLEAARQALALAYAPYSSFQVGCALLLDDGEIITGNNQENLAFPSGLCAERVALFAAGAQGKTESIVKMAVRCKSMNHPVNRPIAPCGACRQVIHEYEKQADAPWILLLQGENGKIIRFDGVTRNLLPFSFETEL